MKRFLLLLICTISFSSLKAQRITLNDLKYVLYHNIGATEDYLSKKGFNYAGSDTASKEKEISMANFVKKGKAYVNEITVSQEYQQGQTIAAIFDTFLKSDYIAFKDNITKNGFKMVDSHTTENGSLMLEYHKGKLTVAFTISVIGAPSRNLYSVSVLEK